MDIMEIRKAKDMYEYSLQLGYVSLLHGNDDKKDFKVIEENLEDDESILLMFIAVCDKDVNPEFWGNSAAFVFTTKRLIVGQKGFFGSKKVKTVYLKNVTDVTVKKGKIRGSSIVINAISCILKFSPYGDTLEISNKILEIINESKTEQNTKNSNFKLSGADDIFKYKQLMDAGIITKEEFEFKKKQILGM